MILRYFSLFVLFTLFIVNIQSQTKTYGQTFKTYGGDENGYVLFSPIGSDSTFLINKCGQRVHSWKNVTTPGMSLYLKPNGNLVKAGVYSDTTFNTAGGKGGAIEEYDWDGNLIWSYVVLNDSLLQHHDIEILPNGNILILAWHQISNIKAMSLGRKSENFSNGVGDDILWGEKIIEIKPIGSDSAEVVWEWDLFDHIIQDYDQQLPNFGVVSNNPQLMNINYALDLKTYDWIHANSVAYNQELDQIVISCHNISEFWIIDHSTTIAESKSHSGGLYNKGGDILYRWGNPAAYNSGSQSDRKLFRQHDAHWIPKGYLDEGKIMLFNNGSGRDTAYSSVEIIEVPDLSNNNYTSSLPYGPISQYWIYKDSVPTRFFDPIISGARRLPNGNTLICSGTKSLFFEVTPNGKTVWKYKNPYIANIKQTDGTTPKNANVFRCSFYPDTFSGFKNKNMLPKGYIEKNPLPSSCIYGVKQPFVVSFTPAKLSKKVSQNTVLRIKFDRGVLKRNVGGIDIYSNNQLIEYIPSNSNNITVDEKTVFITPTNPLPLGAVIKVRMRVNSFIDSSGLIASKSIDSSEWIFTIVNFSPQIVSKSPNHNETNVNPTTKIKFKFNEKVSKVNVGYIELYESFVLKERINITSNQIMVSDSSVEVTPTSSFLPGKTIFVLLDSCFVNEDGVKNKRIEFSQWQFLTQPEPKVAELTPLNQSKNIAVDSDLKIKFNQNIQITLPCNISIYENNVLLLNSSLSGQNVVVDSNSISVSVPNNFKNNARISIGINGACIKNNFGIPFVGLDSSAWHFNSIKGQNNSIKDVKTNSISIYPNPSQGLVHLVSNITLPNTCVLIDCLGKTHHLNINNNTININEFVSGVYLLVIDNQVISKIIKE